MKKIICIICMMILIVGCQSESQKPKEVVDMNLTAQIIEKDDKEVQTENKKDESSKKQDKQEKKDDEVKKTEKESKPNTSSTSQKDKTISREEKSDKPNTSSSSTKPTNQLNKNEQTENDNKKPTQSPKPTTDENDKKEEKPHQHMFAVNGGWFQTQADAETRFDEELKKWDEKLENKEITWEEYGQKCPCGYEVFRCTCGMHGLNYSYER